MLLLQPFHKSMRTSFSRIVFNFFFLSICSWMILPCIAQTHSQKQEDLDNHGHRLHVTLYLPSTPDSASQPTIVFESGLGNDGDIWSAVIAQLPSNVRLVTYDRPSLGLSEPDGQLPTEEHCAEVLHEALKKVATPPFLLVGHS